MGQMGTNNPRSRECLVLIGLFIHLKIQETVETACKFANKRIEFLNHYLINVLFYLVSA
jgi:hypothetical protein